MASSFGGRVILVYGVSYTGKTTFVMGEDDDDYVDYYEMERGGWRRAELGIPHKERVSIHTYRTPATDLAELGTVMVGEKGGTAPRPAQKLEGWLETYVSFKDTFIAGLSGPGRPVIDTGTRTFLLISNGWSEQLQKATGNAVASLDQLKYTAANSRMTQLVDEPEKYGKDLMIISHEETKFGTSIIQADGYKHLPGMSDIILRFVLKDDKPVAIINKFAEAGFALNGLEIEQPTLKKVKLLLDCAVAIRTGGYPMPEGDDETSQYEAIVAQGKMLGAG
jgi:hypothetical protein